MRNAILACLLIAGCASTSGGLGHSEYYPTDPKDAPVLAQGITEFVAQKQSPGDGAIVFQPVDESDPVATDLRKNLMARGYQVNVGAGPINRVLKYEIGPFQHSILVRVSLNGGDAAKLYTRTTDGTLAAASPFTSRGPGEGS